MPSWTQPQKSHSAIPTVSHWPHKISSVLGGNPQAVLVKVSIAMRKHHDQKQDGEERVCLAYRSTCNPSRKKSAQELKQVRNLDTGAGVEAMEGAVHWLAPHTLLWQIPYRTQAHQPRGNPTPQQSLIKKTPFRRHFLESSLGLKSAGPTAQVWFPPLQI